MVPNLAQLAGLSAEQLSDTLIEIADDVRQRLREGDHDRPLAYAEELERLRPSLSGASLAIVEVTIEVLRACSRGDLGKREKALRAFLARTGDPGAALLEALTTRSLSMREAATAIDHQEEPLRELIRRGILRDAEEKLDVAPDYRPRVLELIEPREFRMWGDVEAARSTIARSPLDINDSASFLASQLGLSQDVCRRHLRRHPVVHPFAGLAQPKRAPKYFKQFHTGQQVASEQRSKSEDVTLGTLHQQVRSEESVVISRPADSVRTSPMRIDA